MHLRVPLRLFRRAQPLESSVLSQHLAPLPPAKPLRLTELVNGRAYAIEVLPVGRDRWRAQLANRGTTTAVMPFYGATPTEAAAQLAAWLTRVSAARGGKSAQPGESSR